MRFFLLFLNLFVSLLNFSQNEVIKKKDNSILLKGSIEGNAITLFLENREIIECDSYDRFIKGWYFYDKDKRKIPLHGFSNGCDMKLFNFGKNYNSVIKNIANAVNQSTIDSVYMSSNYDEILFFDRCANTDKKIAVCTGKLNRKLKSYQVIINSDNIFVGKAYEYFQLPNKKNIDLRNLFTGYGGNNFYSLTQDKTQNRVIFYFESESNHNFCGYCGASEGEKGYRIIYFDKNWNCIKKEEFLTESCLYSIYDTEIVKKTNAEMKYKITSYNEDVDTTYFLTINKLNSTIIKTIK